MNNDQTNDPIDLRNVTAADTTGKPIVDSKVQADNKAKEKDQDKAKIAAPGVLRDLRDN